MSNVFSACRKMLRFAPPTEVDDYAEKQLRNAVFERVGDRFTGGEHIADFRLKINDRTFDWIYDAFVEEEEIKRFELEFYNPKIESEWNYNVPTRCIKILPGALGWIYTIERDMVATWDMLESSTEQKCMFRGYITSYYKPCSLKKSTTISAEELEPFQLADFETIWKNVKKNYIVPFRLRLCAYTQQTRYAYDLDLVNNKLVKDIREGKIVATNHEPRSAMQFYQMDKILSSTKLPELAKKIFEAVFECKIIDVVELAHAFGLTENTTRTYLGLLFKANYLDIIGIPPNERYKINMKKIAEEGS